MLDDGYVSLDEIKRRRMAERELGVVELHGGTEMSMSLREETLIEEKRLPFLSASEVIHEKQLLSKELGPLG